jgi:hypothetical protein
VDVSGRSIKGGVGGGRSVIISRLFVVLSTSDLFKGGLLLEYCKTSWVVGKSIMLTFAIVL